MSERRFAAAALAAAVGEEGLPKVEELSLGDCDIAASAAGACSFSSAHAKRLAPPMGPTLFATDSSVVATPLIAPRRAGSRGVTWSWLPGGSSCASSTSR
mgnify:CR=1 FL=1